MGDKKKIGLCALVCAVILLARPVYAQPEYDCSKGVHQYEVEILVPVSYETDGIRQFTCQICKDSYTEAIPSYGHDWSEWIIEKEPGCIEEGIRYRHCLRDWHDEVREEEPIKALGHDYSAWIVDRKPTKDKEGHRYKVCRRDSSHVIEEMIPRIAVTASGEEEPSHPLDMVDAVLIVGSGAVAAVFGILTGMDLMVLLWARKMKKQTMEQWKAGRNLYDK